MSACVDCGGRRGPICPPCVDTAQRLGLSADERLDMLGHPRLTVGDGWEGR